MKSRELYQKKFEAQLHEWSARLDLLSAQAESMTAQARIDFQPTLDAVQAKFTAAKARLADISEASEDRWDELVKTLDHGWTELKSAADGAYEAIRGLGK